MKKQTWYMTGILSFAAVGALLVLCLRMPEEFPRTMSVNVNVCNVRVGAGEEFDAAGECYIRSDLLQ